MKQKGLHPCVYVAGGSRMVYVEHSLPDAKGELNFAMADSTHRMIVSCLLGGNGLQRGINVRNGICMPNLPKLEEAFRTVGKIFSVRT